MLEGEPPQIPFFADGAPYAYKEGHSTRPLVGILKKD